MKKIIPKKKVVICDFCGSEIYTNQHTGDQWGGVRFNIRKRTFVGLFGVYDKNIDLCTDCFKKLTGKEYTYDWGKDDDEGK